MRSLNKAFGLAVICGLLCAPSLPGQEMQQQPSETSVSLLKVGPVDVSNGEHVVLQQPIADLFGHAWNYQNKEFYGLLRFREGRQWYVAAASKSEPGGVFNIEGVRFPQAGDFELVVALREQHSLSVANWIDESQWRDQSLAVTQRVSITVENPPNVEGDSGEGESYISILSIANVSLRPREINSVPAGGDVVLKARGLPNSKFYLAVHVPYTDLCSVLGPAKKGRLPNTYILHSASFEAPGDPQQIHFDLVAFASTTPVKTGPMSWQSFRLAETVASPTLQILIEGRQLRVDPPRVPFIAITRLGQHMLNAEESASRRLDVEQGDVIEVNAYERLTEGAMLWALTRPKGSNVWFAQGPLLPRGNHSSESPDEHPPVTWVLPSLQFERPDKKGTEGTEFEVMAVLSNAIFPNSWISSVSLSAQTIETISQPVPVNVDGSTSPSEVRLSITHIGSQEADVESEMTVGNTESVVISRPEDFSKAFKIYVGKHVIGATTWSFVEAIPNGKSHFIPTLSFSNPHAEEGTLYQLVAIATKGPLPAHEAEYQDFLPHVVMASDLINVRYSSASVYGFLRSLFSWLLSEAEPGAATTGPQEVKTKMWWIWPLAILVVLFLIFCVLTWLIFRSNPALAGEIADTLQIGYASGKKRFELPESVNPAYFLLGVVLLTLVLYVIRNYYIHLYTTIVVTVMRQPPKESAGLAFWLILITALAGIFADIAYKFSKQSKPEPVAKDLSPAPENTTNEQTSISIYRYIFAGSMLIAVLLWVFQGLIYYSFFKQTSVNSDPLLGAVGFGFGFLISVAETILFFIITELTLVPAGWLIVVMVLAPFYVASLFFRFVQRVFEARRRPEHPPNHRRRKRTALIPSASK